VAQIILCATSRGAQIGLCATQQSAGKLEEELQFLPENHSSPFEVSASSYQNQSKIPAVRHTGRGFSGPALVYGLGRRAGTYKKYLKKIPVRQNHATGA
jgi:hypothetical protein